MSMTMYWSSSLFSLTLFLQVVIQSVVNQGGTAQAQSLLIVMGPGTTRHHALQVMTPVACHWLQTQP